MPPDTLLLAGLVFVAVTLAAVALALLWEWTRERRRRREVMRHLRGAVEERETGAARRGPLLRTRLESQASWLAPLLARIPQLRDLDHWLEQAGVGWSVQTYMILSAGIAGGVALVALILTRSFLLVPIFAALGLFLPYVYVRRRKTLRLRAFEEQLPEAIELLGRAIRAGHPLSAGLRMVAEESPDPVATEFRRVFEEQRFGLPQEDALLGLTDRVDLVDVRILVTAVLIQREVGGNLAEILDKIAQTIRARFTIRRQLRVYTAQGRFSGYVLAVLPIAVGSIIFMLNPDYILTLFREPAGRFMVGLALILQVLGYLWIRRIVNIEI